MESTYARDAASMAAQGVGQDWVNLLVGVPTLLLSFIALQRGHRVGSLVYGGALFYFLYSFIIYAFGVHFNQLFLVYCAVLGLCLYAFILYAVSMSKVGAGGWFDDAPVRFVAFYLIIVALLLYVLWLSAILPAVLQDTVPAEVRDYDLLVNPVHVIDIAFALPGLLIAAALLWRREDFGYVLSCIALVFLILLTIALAGMVIALIARGVSEDFTIAFVFGGLFIATIGVTYSLFRKIRPDECLARPMH